MFNVSQCLQLTPKPYTSVFVPPQKVFGHSKPTPNTFSESTWRPRENYLDHTLQRLKIEVPSRTRPAASQHELENLAPLFTPTTSNTRLWFVWFPPEANAACEKRHQRMLHAMERNGQLLLAVRWIRLAWWLLMLLALNASWTPRCLLDAGQASFWRTAIPEPGRSAAEVVLLQLTALQENDPETDDGIP